MSLTIAPESPQSADAAHLLDGSEAALRAVYTAEECFTFTPAELANPSITFLVARLAGQAVGCVALCDYGDYGEIKRLFTLPKARGQGVARALMGDLERRAQAMGHTRIRLETGDKLADAVRLYRALGYRTRGPFGDYQQHPASLFMEKGV